MNDEKPYIEEPDVLDDDIRNGLYCFLNPDRPCGGDCIAYTTLITPAGIISGQQANCLAIVSLERIGRYAGTIAKLLHDAARTQQPAPKNPMGG